MRRGELWGLFANLLDQRADLFAGALSMCGGLVVVFGVGGSALFGSAKKP